MDLETNVVDICTWLDKVKNCEKEGLLLLDSTCFPARNGQQGGLEEERALTVRAKLRGNLFALWECAAEDGDYALIGLVVMERVVVEMRDPSPHFPYAFNLTFPDDTFCQLSTFSEEDRDSWVETLAAASQEMLRVLAETLYREIRAKAASPRKESGVVDPVVGGLLVNGVSHHFEIPVGFVPSQSKNQETLMWCEEWMYESRMSFVLPTVLIGWNISSWWRPWLDELEEFSSRLRGHWHSACLSHIRHVSSCLSQFQRALDFLESFSGPSFKRSVCRDRQEFLFVPTNLHLQRFVVQQDESYCSWDFLTSGACAAIALNFDHGGCRRIREHLSTLLGGGRLDAYRGCRRQKLKEVSKQLRQCTKLLDQQNSTGERELAKVLEHLLLELKEVSAKLAEVISAWPGVAQLVEELVTDDSWKCDERLSVVVEDVEATTCSLRSKVDSLKRFQADNENVPLSPEWIRSGKDVARSLIHLLHRLQRTLEEAYISDVLLSICSGADTLRLYYHLQFRADVVFSQTLTVVSTGLLSKLWLVDKVTPEEGVHFVKHWHAIGPLFSILSYLSSYKHEKGMMEDMVEAFDGIRNRCSFRFVRAFSQLRSPSCVPLVEGSRQQLLISLPVPEVTFSQLPVPLQHGRQFGVYPIFWNIGINHEASLSQAMGDTFQNEVNARAFDQLMSYIELRGDAAKSEPELAHALPKATIYCSELKTLLSATKPPGKNIQLLYLASKVNKCLYGIVHCCCKSGKDRTSMGVTLEEGQILRETMGLSEQRRRQVVGRLRSEGVRRENCRKNIGVPQYAFSAFQIPFLPSDYRPPPGTHGMLQT